METGLNFRDAENRRKYENIYKQALGLFKTAVEERYVDTVYGKSHVLLWGNDKGPALVLLHAASCGSVIWYPNAVKLSSHFRVYAIDLIGECSMSILQKKLKTPLENAHWLQETLDALGLDNVFLCGLSIGGWAAANYAGYFPERVRRLVLLSSVQTFAKMHTSYFLKIMKMGMHPTRTNVEHYIGWGSEKEAPLPEVVIQLFIQSVMNMNSNVSFPKWMSSARLQKLQMPVLVMFGEREFAFSVEKAEHRARKYLPLLELEIIQDASHLLSVSAPEVVNSRIIRFLTAE